MASARYTVEVHGRTVEVVAEVVRQSREDRAQGIADDVIVESATLDGYDLTRCPDVDDATWSAIAAAVIAADSARRADARDAEIESRVGGAL